MRETIAKGTPSGRDNHFLYREREDFVWRTDSLHILYISPKDEKRTQMNERKIDIFKIIGANSTVLGW